MRGSADFSVATFSQWPSFFAGVPRGADGVVVSAEVFAFGVLRALLVVGFPAACVLRRDLLAIMGGYVERARLVR